MTTTILLFEDLACLAILEQIDSQRVGIAVSFNRWLVRNQIPVPAYTSRITSRAKVPALLSKLRELGYVTTTRQHKLTERGRQVLAMLPTSKLEWPVEIPINDGELDWDHAVYPARFIGYGF